MIRGILVKPNELPQIIEFKEGYKELQKLVEGCFEMPYFFDDVDIVINEEGKLNGSLPNKLIYVGDELVDIVYGNILLVGSNDEGETISLTPKQITKYMTIMSNVAIKLR